jgi:hypothetical protein
MEVLMTTIARKRSVATVAALLIALGAVGGCTAASGDGGHPSPGQAEVAEALSGPRPTELASITAYDRKVTFYSRTLPNGQPDFGMSESGSAYDDRPLVATLLRQKLTSQEVYLALAAEGAAAPPALVAAQDQEAAALGRSAEVRHATVPSEFVQKNWTAQSCANATGFNSTWYQGYIYSYSNTGSVDKWFPSATQCQYTKGQITMGTCNSGSVPYDWYMTELYGNSCGSEYVIDSLSTVQPGQYYYYYWTNSGGAVYHEFEDTWGGPGATFYMIEGWV